MILFLMENLKLYVMETWPYCQKVVNFLKENNLEVDLLDIDKEARLKDELKNVGGKVQVPMLLVEGKPLYESDDIIEWFKKHKL